MKKYKVTRHTAAGMMGTREEERVIECEEGSQPTGAVEVPADTPTTGWTTITAHTRPSSTEGI